MSTLLSWVVDGNAYWYIERSAAGFPVGLTYIPHYRIEPAWPKDGSAYRSGYVYRVDGQTRSYKITDIVHFQNGQDPANERKGLSPLAAELRSVCADHEAQTYTASLLRNMGVPGVVVSPKDASMDIPPEQARALKELWREAVTGDNRGQPIVPTLPVEVQNPGFSPEQLALDKIARFPTPRLLAPLGIDPMLLGLPSDTKTYANMEQAREHTYEQVLIPLQATFDSQLTMQLMPQMPGTTPQDRLGRDYSDVRCLQEDMDKLWARLTRAVGGPWKTVNEARAEVGLDPLEGGDDLYEKPAPLGPEPSAERRAPSAIPQAARLRAELAAKWQARRAAAERNGNGA
jgi:HK97 family phage portal protein